MATKMMQGTIKLPANVAMKEIKEVFVVEGEKGCRKEGAKATTNALQFWKE